MNDDIKNSFTPAFIDFFCRKYGISHYAYDMNKVCFMKYVHKNQNKRALCYYAMNNHMYLVKNKKMVKSMVEKAKSIDHNINTSLFENDEVVNHYNDKQIYTNKSIKNIKNNHSNKTNIIYMYSREIKNINDIFDDFIEEFNLAPIVMRCNKTNIMEFHHVFEDGTRNIYS